MRITGGTSRGFNLRVPRITDIRPAQEMVRLAVFSILAEEIQGAHILDLYAGSGSFGLEALSRGAGHATFVDSNPLAIEAIETNSKNAKFWGKTTVVKRDAIMYLSESHATFDIIFVCPPYSYGIPSALLYNITDNLKPGGVVVFDHARTSVLEKKNLEGLEIVDQRIYGASGVTFLRHANEGTSDQ